MKPEPGARVIDMKRVKLIDGPLRGQYIEVPRSAERARVALWDYQYAGKVDNFEVFARIPRTSADRRYVAAVIRTQGKHPRVLADTREPFTHTLTKAERLAARRVARKARQA